MENFDFNQLMANPMFQMGLGLLSQSRTHGQPGSLAGALGQFQQLQQGSQAAMLNQMKLKQIQEQLRKQKEQEELMAKIPDIVSKYNIPATPGAIDQGMLGPNLPIQSQQANMLAGQMGANPSLADLIALNQSANYTQQGTPQELPLQGRSAGMDYEGLSREMLPIQMKLDPTGTLSDLMKREAEQRKLAGYQDFVKSLPENIDPTARAILSNPEIAKTIGPGVLPSLMKPKEMKPLEGEQGRSKFKIFPDMTPEQAKAVGAQYIPGVGGVAKGEKDKPVQVHVGGGRGSGKAPSGYRFTADGNLEMIPGGPADVKAKAIEEKNALLTDAIKKRSDLVIGKIDDALANVGDFTTGIPGKIFGAIPGTPAFDLDKQIDSIKANIGFSELQAMRQASPTGGALGQVAVQELNMLQAVLGSLEKGQSKSEITKNLKAVKTHYENWKNAVDKANKGASSNVDSDPLGLR